MFQWHGLRGTTPLPSSHESIIHHSGPLPRSTDAKYENLGVQKVSNGNMDPFAKQRSENHFNILQTCIPTNKEKADVVQVWMVSNNPGFPRWHTVNQIQCTMDVHLDNMPRWHHSTIHTLSQKSWRLANNITRIILLAACATLLSTL